jgi:hypothetical protein
MIVEGWALFLPSRKFTFHSLLTEIKQNDRLQKLNLEYVNFKWEDILHRFSCLRHYFALQHQNQSRQVLVFGSIMYLPDSCLFDWLRRTEYDFHLQ